MPHRDQQNASRPAASVGGPCRALITGGSGFIGSHLADVLLARGDFVTVVDNLSTGRRANLPASHERLEFMHADAGVAVKDALAGRVFDEVYHLAAAVGVKLVVDDPIGSIENNVEQAGEVLRFASRCGSGGRGARTLIASSSEVYGKSDRVPFSEDDDVAYGPTTKSRWSYAASKAIDEYLALAYHQQRGVPTVVARFFNTVGPRQVGEYGMVLPRFVAAAVRGEPLTVLGDGEQSRCFCDVRDVAEVLPRLLATPACFGRVFNVGSDRSLTIMELARLVVKVTNSSSPIRTQPYESAYSAGFEDLRRREPNLARVRAAVGFSPRRTLEETIRDLADELKRTRGA